MLLAVSSEEEEEDGDDPLFRYAVYTLDALSVSCPSKTILPIVGEFVKGAVASPEWSVRRAAACAIAVVCEGCQEQMRKSLKDWVAPLMALLDDKENRVLAEVCMREGCEPRTDGDAGLHGGGGVCAAPSARDY